MIILFSLLIEIIAGMIFLPSKEVNELFSFVCIVINTLLLIFFILKTYKEYRTTVIIAYFLRLFLLFASYYHLFPIIHDGSDTEAFDYAGKLIMNTGSFEYARINYLYFIGSLYSLIGPQRLFVQYINVIFGMTSIYFIYKTLLLLELNKKTIKLFMLIMCFLPHNIIFSGILLRESFIILAVSISVFYFVNWVITYKFYYFAYACCAILLATWMHSGMMGVFAGYLLSFTFYKYKDKKLAFSWQSIGASVLCIFLIIYVISTGIFTTYFDKILKEEDATSALLYQASRVSLGGSKYLTWININSPIQFLLFSPLKMFYFLFSPIPLDWRGIIDIIAFCFNSIILIYLFWFTLGWQKYIIGKREKIIVKLLLLSMFFTIFIYAYGVFASGPAMRHRTKIVPILIVTAAIAYDYKQKNKIKKIKF